MFPKWNWSKKEEEACEEAYSAMPDESLEKEINKLKGATEWTPEELAVLSPEDQQYVLNNIDAINQQINIAERHRK